jgi:Inner membrane protein YgaP-like, transmembrane domain
MFARLFPLNEHPIDRVLRVALGIGLLSLTVVGPRTPWGLLGIIPLVTGVLGSCPLYRVFGLSSSGVRSH